MIYRSPISKRRPALVRLAATVLVTVLAGAASPVGAPSQESKFLAENQVAMAKMMTAMNVQPSGDVDRDFVGSMVPHHQGAIDMARAELHYGRNEQLRRIAQGIVVEQGQEIAAMRLALDERLAPPSRSQQGTRQTTSMQTPRSPQ